MITSRWDDMNGELSEATIRRRYAGSAFRVSRSVYPFGTEFVGRTKACTMFVVRGAVRLRSGEEGQFVAGDVIEIEAGTYELEVSSDADVEIVTVWSLRPFMN